MSTKICFHHVRNIRHYANQFYCPQVGETEISRKSEEYVLIILQSKNTSGTQVAVGHSIYWVCMPQKVQVESPLCSQSSPV